MEKIRLGYFVGSLARASINRRLARALVRLAPADLEMTEIAFADLPLYSWDYDADYPPQARRLKEELAAVDAVLFVTPEYNRSIPGALKNAIDWASRPKGENALTRKPAAIIGASTGKLGTAIAQTHLRSILGYCKSPLFTGVEAYIQYTPGLVDDADEVTEPSTREFLRGYMSELHAFLVRVAPLLPRRPTSRAGRRT